MKRSLARSIKNNSQQVAELVKNNYAKLTDVCKKLLNDNELTLKNIEELGQRIAENQNYEIEQLIVCNENTLKERLSSCQNENLEQQPVFIICRNENNLSATFCIVKLLNQIICLIKDFSGQLITEISTSVVKECFGENVQFKIDCVGKKVKNSDILCLKSLEIMMTYIKSHEKENFIKSFDDDKETFFDCLKRELKHLKKELFCLVKEGYYATIASDIDQLSRDTKFKKAIKELINKIPQPEDIQTFKDYQNHLNEFVVIDENGAEVDSAELERLEARESELRNKFLNKAENFNLKLRKNGKGNQQLDIVERFPTQMEKFTGIFEPLILYNADKNLDVVLQEISSKLELDYKKLKIFFDYKEEEVNKPHVNEVNPSIRHIDEIVNALPARQIENTIPVNTNKTFEQILSEITITSEFLNVQSLQNGYSEVKRFDNSWNSCNIRQINEWASFVQEKPSDLNIFEAIAVLDRANELVTEGHRFRDTQILSALTFLHEKDTGQLTQIQTGEGKTTIVCIVAAIQALRGKKVDIITSNSVLASEAVRVKQDFFNSLNLSVATNNIDGNAENGPRECYRADIVYGCISNFQFDYLKDSFLGLKTRARRKFECIILDEVDSMLVDNVGHMTKLAESLPGMESLKYIYIKIWQELHKAVEKCITDELTDEIVTRLALRNDRIQSISDLFQDEFIYSLMIQKITESIKQSNPTKIDIIPSHIQEYADNSLNGWIASAFTAKFIYQQDKQYIIAEDNGEKVIRPVDYKNTGVTLKNTILHHGLHQFLQLKHNLRLTFETLTSCFISNLSYIKKYGNQIYGLTGTLGSDAEQKLFSTLFNVCFATIPTYKEKKFTEIDGVIVDDNVFSAKVGEIVTSVIDDGRAVLIICETIKDAKAIERVILMKPNMRIKTFFDENSAHVTEEVIDSGDVVIATNIAGRGTDFKTSTRLETNGGLHVLTAFLPSNKRVEDQAKGRTARQGNWGTAQLVIKQSEIDDLNVSMNCIEEIKIARDLRESDRIHTFAEIKLREIEFQDRLFERFSALYRKLNEDFECKRERQYAVEDLKEFWAFWLAKQNFCALEIANTSVENKFRIFVSEIQAQKTIEGEIQFNPYYSIQQAEYFIWKGKLNEAEQSLKHAINISNNPEILHSVYLKLFEITIAKGRVFRDKLSKALADCFSIPSIEPSREYQQHAKMYLVQAKQAFKKEFDYIQELFEDKQFPCILRNSIDNEDGDTLHNQRQNENLFLKHIVSKQHALLIEMDHADSLIKQIDNSKVGLSIGCRIPNFLYNLEPANDSERKMKEMVTNSELIELAEIGSNITYVLREVHDVCPEIIKLARIQILAGIGILASGLCFPPAMPVTSPIGGTLIGSGLGDIVCELINMNSDGKFDKKAYIKSKLITGAILLLSLGASVLSKVPELLQKAENACRWTAEALRKSRFLKEVCESLAIRFDKLGDWFAKMRTISMFNSMNNVEQLSYANDLQRCGNSQHLEHLGVILEQHQNIHISI